MPGPAAPLAHHAALLIQTCLALIGLLALRRHVYPHARRAQDARTLLEVGAPLAVVLPMVVAAVRVRGSVAGAGWLAVGAPVVCGWMGLAAALVLAGAAPRGAAEARRDPSQAVWLATGLLLLLLAAAQVMTVWVGQTALALATVLLWLKTSPEPAPGGGGLDPSGRPAAVAVTVAVAAGIGQGVLAARATGPLAAVAGGLIVGYATVAVVAAAAAGPAASLRVGGWAATYGVLLSLGLMGLMHLLPAAARIFGGARTTVDTQAAYGFAAYAPEACGLLVLAPAAWGARLVPAELRAVLGAPVVGVLAVLAAWRLAAVWNAA